MQIIVSYIELVVVYNSTTHISTCKSKLKNCIWLKIFFPDFFQKYLTWPSGNSGTSKCYAKEGGLPKKGCLDNLQI